VKNESHSFFVNILVVDDETVQREIICDVLENDGYTTVQAEGVRSAIATLEAGRFDLVVTDLKMPDGDGLELLQHVRRICPDVEVIMMTAYGSIANAVTAIKQGAADYITKPFDKSELLLVVRKAVEHRQLQDENRWLHELVKKEYRLGNIIGESKAMRDVFRVVEKAMHVDSTVLVEGESGTGKELVAHSIHFGGPRAEQPFVVVNCAAMPEHLVESELFGHEKGAFTGATQEKRGKFELADGGTIFLDEIAEMKPDLQAKLLRVLQDRTFERVGGSKSLSADVRVIAATNRHIDGEVEKGTFRSDLYFRLNVIRIHIPPLRERTDDIVPLVSEFKTKLTARFEKPFPEMEPAVIDAFMSHAWPGNVRELENTLERLYIMCERDMITEADLPRNIREPVSPASGGVQQLVLPPNGVSLDELERNFIAEALERTGGSIRAAAEMLGVTYKTLQYRMKKHGLGRGGRFT